MNKRELERYKKRLLEVRAEILGGVGRISEENLKKSQRDASGDLSGYSFHMADMATDNYDREFSLNLASDNQKLVYAIDEALGRIKDKSYGRCVACNKEISRKRLRAVPYAVLCIECQRKEEKKTSS